MPNTTKSVCDLCTNTLEKGQDILNGEGDCNCTVHRYCAGVTAGHFLTLCKSSTPFVCQWCMLKTTNAVIKQLQSNVASLRTTWPASGRNVEERRDKHSLGISSLKSELASLKDQVSRNRKTSTVSYASTVIMKRTPSVHPRHRTRNNRNLTATTVITTDQTATTGERQEQHPNTSQNLRSGKTKSLVKVVEAEPIEWFNCQPRGDYSNKPRTRYYSKWLVLE